MEFYNKMDFLMKLTQIKNKELAAEISVDRSLISLLRTGKRGIPKNRLHIKRMAESFAKRITTDYQRQALAEISGLPGLSTEVSANILAMQLERWLLGDIDLVDHILDGIDRNEPVIEQASPPQIAAPAGETFFLYGDEGKREALRFMLNNLKEGMIGIFDNTDLGWLVSDPALAAEAQAIIKKNLSKGSTFTQILPPISNIGCYTDSLRFLLPLYISGNTNVFFYPRMMDMTRKITLIVAPGQCVSYSYGYHSASKNMITIVSTNKDFINAHAEQFSEYLTLCRSAMTVHKDPTEFMSLMSGFYDIRGDVVQKILPLSTLSMPVELAELFSERADSFIWKESFRKVAELIPHFEQCLTKYRHLDICPLSPIKDILAGKVAIATPYPTKSCPYYTPETYILHLKNILRLMDEYEGYTFIPIPSESYQGYNLMVNEGGTALLSHGHKHSPLIMEFHRPEVVLSCREHLMRIIDREGGLDGARSRAKAQINALILELEKASKNRGRKA